MSRFFRTYWPSLIVVAVIIYATWIPRPIPTQSLPMIPHIDKLLHAVMFGGLAGALMFDYHRVCINAGRRPLTWKVVFTMAAIAAAFGLFDEIVQGWLKNGRPSEMLDWAADCVGVIVAVFTAPPIIVRIFR